MFSEMITSVQNNKLPDPVMLRNRFEFALTKKLGIVKLPPAFWMRDPKINPPSAHLFWAALLLKDRHRIDMALSVIAVELAENSSLGAVECGRKVEEEAKELVRELLDRFPDQDIRQRFAAELKEIVAEWVPDAGEKPR